MPDLPLGNRIVLFTDIEGSTALRERNRQAKAVAESPVDGGCPVIAESAVAPTRFR
jgi:hypothetical protein